LSDILTALLLVAAVLVLLSALVDVVLRGLRQSSAAAYAIGGAIAGLLLALSTSLLPHNGVSPSEDEMPILALCGLGALASSLYWYAFRHGR
jgi:drug/metabolite transporter (DMT)-like permease